MHKLEPVLNIRTFKLIEYHQSLNNLLNYTFVRYLNVYKIECRSLVTLIKVSRFDKTVVGQGL